MDIRYAKGKNILAISRLVSLFEDLEYENLVIDLHSSPIMDGSNAVSWVPMRYGGKLCTQ
jgi:UDP-3-O-acyl-N-acetylglucosamine deacetylase